MNDFYSHDCCQDCSGRFVCRCLEITEDVVVGAIARFGLTTIKEVAIHTGAGDGCTCCHQRIAALLAENAYSSSSSPAICSVR